MEHRNRGLNARSRFQLWIFHSTSIFLVLSLVYLSVFLLYSLFCLTTSNINNDHTALAIPNQLQKNRNNNNNINNFTSSVKPVNHPPIVKVGQDQTVNESSKVTLFGLAIDPDPNDKLSYSWIQIAGPAVMLNAPNTASHTFTAPSNIPADTALKFALMLKMTKVLKVTILLL